MERRMILSRLLDKYENSKHLLQPGVSTRRVMLRIDQKELPEYKYDEGSAIRDAYNNAAVSLEKDGLVSVEWARPSRMSVIALNLHSLDEAYCQCGRQHPRDRADAVIALLESALPEPSCDWIACWKQEVCEMAYRTYKVPSFCRDDLSTLEKLAAAFRVYDSLNGSPISMRAFSIACFQDSKLFERECRDEFLRIAEKYDVELNETCQQQDLSQREMLAFLGIYARPELFELSGSCKIKTSDGLIDLAAAGKFGIGLPSTMTDSILAFDLTGISKITLIENKTNYDEYLLSEKSADELVLFHGGFLSPQKKTLYEMLSRSVYDGIAVFFWADIDLGGFRMFEKLQAIFPGLCPMRMCAEDVVKYHASGKSRGADYLAQLEDCLREKKYPLFSEAITQILTYGVTIEQEVFLKEKGNRRRPQKLHSTNKEGQALCGTLL